MHTLRLRPTHLTRGRTYLKPSFSSTRPATAQQQHRCFRAALVTRAPAAPSSSTSPAEHDDLLRKPIEGSKNALVTGSARGIGKAIALRLALDGYNVCINDVGANAKACDEVVREIQALGRKACTATADVSKRGEVRDMIQKSVKELGPLHTMYVGFFFFSLSSFEITTNNSFFYLPPLFRVANAGIAQVKSVLDLTEQDFERMLAVNLTGVHNCYLEAAHQMIRQGTCRADAPGKLLGAASIVSFKPTPLLGHYSASKWAVRGLTQVYAMELAAHHITVNAYAPGIVGTAMWDEIDAQLAARKKVAGGDVKKGEMMKEYVERWTLLGRTSVPGDVAKLVSFLASSDSDFVTGQTQVVDGGIVFT